MLNQINLFLFSTTTENLPDISVFLTHVVLVIVVQTCLNPLPG